MGNVNVVDKGELELSDKSLYKFQAPHRPFRALPAKQGRIWKITTIKKSFPSLRGKQGLGDGSLLTITSEWLKA